MYSYSTLIWAFLPTYISHLHDLSRVHTSKINLPWFYEFINQYDIQNGLNKFYWILGFFFFLNGELRVSSNIYSNYVFTGPTLLKRFFINKMFPCSPICNLHSARSNLCTTQYFTTDFCLKLLTLTQALICFNIQFKQSVSLDPDISFSKAFVVGKLK